MIDVIYQKIGRVEIKKQAIRRAAESALDLFKASNSLSVLLTNDHNIRKLNLHYRQIDATTDVLSFPAEEKDPENFDYLGDIAISYPVAVNQAILAGHPVSDEISLLVIHGVLHLLGYDHHSPQEKEEMWSLQAKALVSLGVDMSAYSGDNDD